MNRDDGLGGKVALISGGASGIGRALALAYARAGAHSVVGYYPADPHDVGETVAAVEQEGGRCEAVEVDVRSFDQTERLAQAALDTFGRLDIAVAAAGILRRQPLAEMTDAAWDDMMAVDLSGVLRVFRSCAARMSAGGAMVATSSIAGGVYGWEEHSHYAAAKAGVLGLCRSLAVELAARGIRVNTVIPGLGDPGPHREPPIPRQRQFAGSGGPACSGQDHPRRTGGHGRRGGPRDPVPHVRRRRLRDRSKCCGRWRSHRPLAELIGEVTWENSTAK
jgi:3-oxoacyl-[acyl-carrier protein] reductase